MTGRPWLRVRARIDRRPARPIGPLGLFLIVAAGLLVIADAAAAQDDWDDDWDDNWSSEPPRREPPPSPDPVYRDAAPDYDYGSGGGPASTWSLRAGLGFTADPDDLLLNFELPYRFDRYVSLGPMIQFGVEEDRFLVAPTANLTVTIPDLPGEALDRLQPFLMVGAGFAVINNGRPRRRHPADGLSRQHRLRPRRPPERAGQRRARG